MRRKSRKHEYGDRQTPAQRKWQFERSARDEAYTRWKCNWLRVWRLCPQKRCRRHRSCSGEPHACWELHWNAMPEHFKNRIRVTMQAMARRLPPAEAQRYVEEELARRDEITRKYGPAPSEAAPATAATSAVVSEETADAPITPREPDAPRLRRL